MNITDIYFIYYLNKNQEGGRKNKWTKWKCMADPVPFSHVLIYNTNQVENTRRPKHKTNSKACRIFSGGLTTVWNIHVDVESGLEWMKMTRGVADPLREVVEEDLWYLWIVLGYRTIPEFLLKNILKNRFNKDVSLLKTSYQVQKKLIHTPLK